MIELPDPFRSDWRFAYLITILIKLLGRNTEAVKVETIYNEMRTLFDVAPADETEQQMKVVKTLQAWLPVLQQQAGNKE